MAPTHPYAVSHILRLMNTISGVARPDQSGDGSLHLRSRPQRTATTAETSPSQPSKRKVPVDDRPHTTKRRRKEDTQGSQAVKGQRLSAGPSDRVNLNDSGKPHKRKRGLSLLALSGSEHSKRVKLTPAALKALEASTALGAPKPSSMSQTGSSAPSSSAGRCGDSTSNSSISSSKRSYHSTVSSRSQSFAAKDVRFEACLTELNGSFNSSDQPDPEDVKSLLEAMERGRNSPEPDSGEFYESLSVVASENEAMVLDRLRPLLLPFRDLPRNNCETKDLLYRRDALWKSWGSVYPGYLPAPKPDLCVSFKASAFTPHERKHITSPYSDKAGFYPLFIWEVNTAMQGPQIADRQNANNAISVLIVDFELQQRLGYEMERKVRLITTAHNTRSQWYTVWFSVLGTDGKPKWWSKVIQQYNFQIPEQNGFRAARAANLNICEHLQRVILPQIHTSLANVPVPAM